MADADESGKTPPSSGVIRFPQSRVSLGGARAPFKQLGTSLFDRPLVQPLQRHLVRLSARGDLPGLRQSPRLSPRRLGCAERLDPARDGDVC